MNRQWTGIYLFVPEEFQIEDYPELQEDPNAVHWFLHRIMIGQAQSRHDDGKARISAQTIREYMTGEHKWKNAFAQKMKEILAEAGVLGYDPSDYCSTETAMRRGCSPYSTGYWLREPYTSGFRMVECTDPHMAARILANRITLKHEAMKEQDLDATKQYLTQWLRKLTIDMTEAESIIEGLSPPSEEKRAARRRARRRKATRKAKAKGIPMSLIKKLRKTCQRDINSLYKTACRLTLQQLQDPDNMDITFCPYGRMHDPLTRLTTECRKALRFDGKRLVNIDIRNSQIIFLAVMLMEEFYKREATRGDCSTGEPAAETDWDSTPEGTATGHADLEEKQRMTHFQQRRITRQQGVTEPPKGEKETTGAGTRSNTGGDPPYPQRCSLSQEADAPRWSGELVQALLPPDARMFLELTLAGRIYDHFMDRSAIPVEQQEMARKGFKQQFFCNLLYGDPAAKYVRDSKLAKMFQVEFPSVWRFIVDQKAVEYARLAQKMQVRESDFMFGRVCDRLRRSHADIPVATIHDSILTTHEHAQTVHRIMTEEFARMGIRPTIRISDA